jgi:outer membrane protein TolC
VLSNLVSQEPSYVDGLLGEGEIPAVPAQVSVGIPADLVRRRPDVRAAEMVAVAQTASVGIATADLYPSIALGGSFGVSSISSSVGGGGSSGLFESDGVTWNAGVAFNWPFLNYGRIRNNIRLQDARLQQTLVLYQDTVLTAVKEVDDAIVSLYGAQAQHEILKETVTAAERSNELSVLQYQEGFAGYQRVLDAQRALFSQQNRLVQSRGDAVNALIQLYRALGGGWEVHEGRPYVNEETQQVMRERTNWGDLLGDE